MNITHITDLLRAYYIEHKKRLFIFCLATFAVMVWGYSASALPEISIFVPYFFLWILAGNFFQYSLKKNNTAHFFNLPVTAGEKLTAAIIVLLILGIVLEISGFAGAFTGRVLIRPILYSGNSVMLTYRMSLWDSFGMFWEGNLYFVATLSVFLFGSIYFKTKAFLKTLVCGIGFLMGIALYNMILLLIVFGTCTPFTSGEYSFELVSETNLLHDSFYAVWTYIIPVAATLFFLSLTYLRLKETEV